MRNLSNTIAGVAGLVTLLGALAATPNVALGQSPKMQDSTDSPSRLVVRSTRLGRVTTNYSAISHADLPDLSACPKIEAPEGHRLAFAVYAEGVQIYRWNGTSWTFVAPDALLFANEGGDGAVGDHYAGPTWESVSGSKVVARVVERCTPDPNAIQWLLLEAVHTEGPGIFERVTYIQRLNTVGGLAPTEPGANVGDVARVPYTTDYYFYRAQN